MCIVINIVLGMVISMINIPLLFLDTVGTVLGAVVLGPLGCSYWWMYKLSFRCYIRSYKYTFALVNIVLGLIVGYISKKKVLVIKKLLLQE